MKGENTETTTFEPPGVLQDTFEDYRGNSCRDNRDVKCQQTEEHHFSVIEEKPSPSSSLKDR